MKIAAHVLVKNEYMFIWYAVQSVAPYVDHILLWDTGSTDGTLEIINELKNDPIIGKKISFESHPEEFNEELIRQQMLDKTNADWFIVVDGDEIWWNDSIKQVTETIRLKGKTIESIVVPTINAVGDMYHYQEERAGNYTLAGRTGHYAIRAINKSIPGLHSYGRHGIWGWVDDTKKPIQDRNQDTILFLNAPYLHTTFLSRAHSRAHDNTVVKRSFKRKYEIGIEFHLDFYYPEALFKPRPSIVPSIWSVMTPQFKRRAAFLTPLKKVKRRILPRKVGY